MKVGKPGSTGSSGTSTEAGGRGRAGTSLVICLENTGYEASLESRKVYARMTDPEAAKHGQVRIVDESGEDYLYPARLFRRLRVSETLRRAILGGS